MSLNIKTITLLIVGSAVFLFMAYRFGPSSQEIDEPRLLSLATDITDLPRTRRPGDVSNRVIEIRKAELVAAHRLDPKKVFIKVKGEPVLNKFEEFYMVTFEIEIKGVRGLYAERYTVRTTKKRMFNITDVQYDHKCTKGKTVQKWTIEPCDIKTN